MYDIIIIGAGPAGLTSAIYARRANKKVLVLEAKTYGGQIINTPKIDNYPAMPGVSGFEYATNLYNQAKDFGAEIKFEKAIDIVDHKEYKEVKTKDNLYKSLTLILATGADNRTLNLDNEKKLLGKGVSYCATCDGNFYKNKVVAVNGGGNTALEDAIYLSNICSKVYLIHRRTKFRADELLIQNIQTKTNIELVLDSVIISINGTEKLESITVQNKDGEFRNIEVQGLFIAVGQVPENENFVKIINVNEKGYIVALEDCKTNVEGIFVAGDNRDKDLRQLVTASSDGAIAANNAVKYINER